MTEQLILPEQIDPNPWQPRKVFDPVKLEALAQRIDDIGLLQKPRVRPHPKAPGRYQAQVGERRIRAWALRKPGVAMPVEVVEATDLEMSTAAASENTDREPLTPIEVANAILERMKQFGMSQLEAATPFGYKSASAVSNLLRLLKLPAPVQKAVNDGMFAERNARMLLPLERLDPGAAVDILNKSFSAENKEAFIDDAVGELLYKKGLPLKEAPWARDWPKQPLVLEAPQNGLKELVACNGCAYSFRRDRGDPLCTRKECYDAKLQLAVPKELERVSRKLKIAVAAAEEKPTLVYDGTYQDFYKLGRIERLIAHPTAELRLVPWTKNDNNDYGRKNHLGSAWVALATVDPAITNKTLSPDPEVRQAAKEQFKAKRAKKETEKEREQRVAAEQKEAQAKRAARSKFNKEKHDVLWLMEHASQLIAERIAVTPGAFLHFVEEELVHRVAGNHFGEMNVRMDLLEEAGEKATGPERDRLRRERIAYSVIAAHVVRDGYYSKPEDTYRFGQVRRLIVEVCKEEGDSLSDTDRFGVKLPAGWDQPPIQKLEFNCWDCGAFAPGERITKKDLAEGWQTERMIGGKSEHYVRCPACATKQAERKIGGQLRELRKDGALTAVKTAKGAKKPKKAK